MHAFYHWLWRLAPGNPMVVRIVQNASRRPRHLWVRMAYLGLMITIVTFGMLLGGSIGESSLTDLAKAGSNLFYYVAFGQVLLVCLLAPLFMAGAIAEEQAGQTLNILLTTPLTNLQIVLGSLLGRLFFVLALIASGLPLFAVLLVFGGVPTSSVFVAFATAALVAVTVGSTAVMLSVMRTGGRKAVFIFVIAVVGYLLVAYVVDTALLRRIGPTGQTTWLTPLHPILVLESTIHSADYRPPAPETLGHLPAFARFYLARPFASFALLSMSVSAVMILWSALMLRTIGTLGGQTGFFGWLARKVRLRAEGERRRPPRNVWHNPVAWREANTRGQNLAATIGRGLFVFIGLALMAVMLVMYHFQVLPPIPDPRFGGTLSQVEVFRLGLLTLLLLELAIIVMVAIYLSAGAVSREREDGTLDLLLTTPVTPKQFIWGKLRGLVSFLTLMIAVPVLSVALVAGYTVLGVVMQWPQAMPSTPVATGGGPISVNFELMMIESPLLLALMLVPFVALCVMVGMGWSLKAKGVLGAVLPSLAVLGVFALVIGFCGYASAENIFLIGPIINAFSPATNLTMLINPYDRVSGFADSPGFGRLNLLIAAALAAGGYSLIVYSMLLGMVRGFDQTVRKLTGTA